MTTIVNSDFVAPDRVGGPADYDEEISSTKNVERTKVSAAYIEFLKEEMVRETVIYGESSEILV